MGYAGIVDNEDCTSTVLLAKERRLPTRKFLFHSVQHKIIILIGWFGVLYWNSQVLSQRSSRLEP